VPVINTPLLKPLPCCYSASIVQRTVNVFVYFESFLVLLYKEVA